MALSLAAWQLRRFSHMRNPGHREQQRQQSGQEHQDLPDRAQPLPGMHRMLPREQCLAGAELARIERLDDDARAQGSTNTVTAALAPLLAGAQAARHGNG